MGDWKSKLDRESEAVEEAKKMEFERKMQQVQQKVYCSLCGFISQDGKILRERTFTGINLSAKQKLMSKQHGGGIEYGYDDIEYYEANDLEVCGYCSNACCSLHIHGFNGKYMCQRCAEDMIKHNARAEKIDLMFRWLKRRLGLKS